MNSKIMNNEQYKFLSIPPCLLFTNWLVVFLWLGFFVKNVLTYLSYTLRIVNIETGR